MSIIENKGILPTDISEFVVKVDGTEMTDMVGFVQVFQDVFTPTWTAAVRVIDTNNHIMTMPIKPGSSLDIKLKSEMISPTDDSKTFKFMVSHISDKSYDNQMNQHYTINGVNTLFFKNQGTRVIKSFKNKKPSAICSSVISDLGGSVAVHPSDANVTFHANNMSPFTVSYQMCGVGTHGNIADYLFFQTDDTKFAFKSIEKLYTTESSGMTFLSRVSAIRNDAGHLNEDYNTCFHQYEIHHYDGMKNKSSGHYANKVVRYNHIDKVWKVKTYKFGDDTPADAAKKPWSNSDFEVEDSHVAYLPEHPGLHESDTVVDTAKDWSNSRRSNLIKLEQDKLYIQVPGGVKGWTYLGKTIEIDLPSQQDYVDTQLDKQLKGTYLCIAICHYVKGGVYMTNYELAKKRHQTKLA